MQVENSKYDIRYILEDNDVIPIEFFATNSDHYLDTNHTLIVFKITLNYMFLNNASVRSKLAKAALPSPSLSSFLQLNFD